MRKKDWIKVVLIVLLSFFFILLGIGAIFISLSIWGLYGNGTSISIFIMVSWLLLFIAFIFISHKIAKSFKIWAYGVLASIALLALQFFVLC